jgi:hypothetical protein
MIRAAYRRRLWLIAAAVVFAADIFLHLPVSDFCDALVKRFGFFPFDGFVRRSFIVLGAVCAGFSWVSPARRRPPVSAAVLVLALTVVAAQMLIVLNAVEDVHYPQYALLMVLLGRGMATIEGAWLGTTMLGAVDEGHQFIALPRGTPTYFDWNDVVLNAIGASFGVLVLVIAWPTDADRPALSHRSAVVATLTAVVAALIVGPPHLSPFYDVTPGGRRFHNMPAFEAVAVVSLLWWGVRYLAGRLSSGAAPNRPAT